MSAAEPRRLGRPRQVDRAAIVAMTLTPPTSGSNRWSCRELSAELGVSEATIARVWREYGLAPKADGQYAFTVQPPLSARRVSVVGVCLTRRVRAIALLVDDPDSDATGIDRSVIGEQDHAGEAARTSGEAATKVGVRDFLRRVSECYPDQALHVVVDSAQLQRLLLQSVPNLSEAGVALHFALDTEKWLNLVDVWSGLMLRDGASDKQHPAARVRELITHGRTMIWVEPVRGRSPSNPYAHPYAHPPSDPYAHPYADPPSDPYAHPYADPPSDPYADRYARAGSREVRSRSGR